MNTADHELVHAVGEKTQSGHGIRSKIEEKKPKVFGALRIAARKLKLRDIATSYNAKSRAP